MSTWYVAYDTYKCENITGLQHFIQATGLNYQYNHGRWHKKMCPVFTITREWTLMRKCCFSQMMKEKLYQMKCTLLLTMYPSKGRRNRTCTRTNTDFSENDWTVRSFCISSKLFWMFDTVLSCQHVKNKKLHFQVIIKPHVRSGLWGIQSNQKTMVGLN